MKRDFISINELTKVLSSKELKNILGGSGGGDGVCCFSEHWSDSATDTCNDADDCIDRAGDLGWWCCNCDSC